jgi:hypothetical protein
MESIAILEFRRGKQQRFFEQMQELRDVTREDSGTPTRVKKDE